MKTKTFRKKLTLNKKTVTNLTGGEKARIKGGYSIYPCEISAPQIICTTDPFAYTCDNCGGGGGGTGGGSGEYSCEGFFC
jgi:hypothetical protein